MPHFFLRILFAIFFSITFYTIYYFSTNHENTPELSGVLAEIRCDNTPVNPELAKRNRALIDFSDFSYMFLCLSPDMIENKQNLKCRDGVCSNQADFSTTFFVDDKDVTRYGYDFAEENGKMISRVTYDLSHAGVSLSKKPSSKKPYIFGTDDIRMASKFELVNKFYCQRQANFFNKASCAGVLSYNSVDIRVSIELFGEKGHKFSEYDAKRQINHWLVLLDAIVQPLP